MTNNTLPADDDDPQKKVVMQVYAALGATMILSLIPNATAAVLCTIFATGVLIAAYRIRNKAEPEGLSENHMIYIIRSIWIGSLFFVITSLLASFYVLANIDYTSLMPCAENLAGSGNLDMAAAMAASEECLGAYIDDNRALLMNAMLYAALPILAYFGYRFVKGLGRASKGYRIAHPKSWF